MYRKLGLLWTAGLLWTLFQIFITRCICSKNMNQLMRSFWYGSTYTLGLFLAWREDNTHYNFVRKTYELNRCFYHFLFMLSNFCLATPNAKHVAMKLCIYRTRHTFSRYVLPYICVIANTMANLISFMKKKLHFSALVGVTLNTSQTERRQYLEYLSWHEWIGPSHAPKWSLLYAPAWNGF